MTAFAGGNGGPVFTARTTENRARSVQPEASAPLAEGTAPTARDCAAQGHAISGPNAAA
ncbi:hypothetical protein [Tropicibacter naphthalenivorans]|uniref:Uncharacterized protein n=1 Tax=Tropicibacter naphthalenivorans TaxID=441103 RepID=A0A0P1H1I3_9RHOB|nr:hypothetical protein [Tropicibacter naphthalenivorans]CUH80704.1 hypothetical protein TRN7648_03102 [Tropicibacter naphthalenivorans]